MTREFTMLIWCGSTKYMPAEKPVAENKMPKPTVKTNRRGSDIKVVRKKMYMGIRKIITLKMAIITPVSI